MAMHNGAFDVFDDGEFATDFNGLVPLAENGNTDPIMTAFADSPAGLAGGWQMTLAATDGPDGAPVYAPGESSSIVADIDDPGVNQYFSFASMVVPSNDLFFANDDFLEFMVFNADGSFAGPVEILVFGADVADAGTEFNSATNDAAFSVLDGQSIPEHNPIRYFFTEAGDQDYLDSFIGTGTANGDTIDASFSEADLVARITIVPAPATAALIGLSGLITLGRRRS
jgi:hypothetical protein